jgi:hypothetical protein
MAAERVPILVAAADARFLCRASLEGYVAGYLGSAAEREPALRRLRPAAALARVQRRCRNRTAEQKHAHDRYALMTAFFGLTWKDLDAINRACAAPAVGDARG